jgi:hypothetical protein
MILPDILCRRDRYRTCHHSLPRVWRQGEQHCVAAREPGTFGGKLTHQHTQPAQFLREPRALFEASKYPSRRLAERPQAMCGFCGGGANYCSAAVRRGSKSTFGRRALNPGHECLATPRGSVAANHAPKLLRRSPPDLPRSFAATTSNPMTKPAEIKVDHGCRIKSRGEMPAMLNNVFSVSFHRADRWPAAFLQFAQGANCWTLARPVLDMKDN